jgi:hypothetical protein
MLFNIRRCSIREPRKCIAEMDVLDQAIQGWVVSELSRDKGQSSWCAIRQKPTSQTSPSVDSSGHLISLSICRDEQGRDSCNMGQTVYESHKSTDDTSHINEEQTEPDGPARLSGVVSIMILLMLSQTT